MFSTMNIKETKKNPYFKAKYDRIKKRRGHKRAIIAVARMILTCLYHMLLKKEAFQPSDICYEELPEQLLQKRKDQYIQQAIKLLEKEGMTVVPPSVPYHSNSTCTGTGSSAGCRRCPFRLPLLLR